MKSLFIFRPANLYIFLVDYTSQCVFNNAKSDKNKYNLGSTLFKYYINKVLKLCALRIQKIYIQSYPWLLNYASELECSVENSIQVFFSYYISNPRTQIQSSSSSYLPYAILNYTLIHAYRRSVFSTRRMELQHRIFYLVLQSRVYYFKFFIKIILGISLIYFSSLYFNPFLRL